MQRDEFAFVLPLPSDIMVAVASSQTSRNELPNFKCSFCNVFVLVICAGLPTDLERVAIYRKLFPSLIIIPLAIINFQFLYLYKYTLQFYGVVSSCASRIRYKSRNIDRQSTTLL